jgi:hypothetical protein
MILDTFKPSTGDGIGVDALLSPEAAAAMRAAIPHDAWMSPDESGSVLFEAIVPVDLIEPVLAVARAHDVRVRDNRWDLHSG